VHATSAPDFGQGPIEEPPLPTARDEQTVPSMGREGKETVELLQRDAVKTTNSRQSARTRTFGGDNVRAAVAVHIRRRNAHPAPKTPIKGQEALYQRARAIENADARRAAGPFTGYDRREPLALAMDQSGRHVDAAPEATIEGVERGHRSRHAHDEA